MADVRAREAGVFSPLCLGCVVGRCVARNLGHQDPGSRADVSCFDTHSMRCATLYLLEILNTYQAGARLGTWI